AEGRLIADGTFTSEALAREFDDRLASDDLARLLTAHRLRGLVMREGVLRLGFQEPRPTAEQPGVVVEISRLVLRLIGGR
ncbi:hypothetical protein GTW43_36600, partial [Streptomyces sp. SID5785]|uniref:hypothetical protein n=1 Tax=Streptomyces sp. SID5785 TaxID=2690309 RepID=UPI00136121C6